MPTLTLYEPPTTTPLSWYFVDIGFYPVPPPPVDIGDVWALQWAAVTPEFFLGKQSGSDKLMPFHEEQFLWVQPSCHYAFHNRTFAEWCIECGTDQRDSESKLIAPIVHPDLRTTGVIVRKRRVSLIALQGLLLDTSLLEEVQT